MIDVQPVLSARWVVLGSAVVALTLAAACPAFAQQGGNAQAAQSESLRDRLFERGLPETARYVSSNGDGFVLDSSGPRPLFRYDRSPEIWVLRATPAPRGDVIYRNDAGDQVLRVTPDGGLTLFSARAPSGLPASSAGPAEPLVPPAVGFGQLLNHLVRQSDIAGRALGHTVEIAAPDLAPSSGAAVADMVTIAVDSIIRMARNASLRDKAAEVQRILIVEGSTPAASFSGGTLRLAINPDQGVAGRPSSARIVRVLSD